MRVIAEQRVLRERDSLRGVLQGVKNFYLALRKTDFLAARQLRDSRNFRKRARAFLPGGESADMTRYAREKENIATRRGPFQGRGGSRSNGRRRKRRCASRNRDVIRSVDASIAIGDYPARPGHI